jgi:hypothetical protein
MVELLAQKLNLAKSDEQRKYIKSRFEMGNNEFSKFLAEGFSKNPKLDMADALSSTVARKDQERAPIVDSYAIHKKYGKQNKYTASNEMDTPEYTHVRTLETL